MFSCWHQRLCRSDILCAWQQRQCRSHISAIACGNSVAQTCLGFAALTGSLGHVFMLVSRYAATLSLRHVRTCLQRHCRSDMLSCCRQRLCRSDMLALDSNESVAQTCLNWATLPPPCMTKQKLVSVRAVASVRSARRRPPGLPTRARRAPAPARHTHPGPTPCCSSTFGARSASSATKVAACWRRLGGEYRHPPAHY